MTEEPLVDPTGPVRVSQLDAPLGHGGPGIEQFVAAFRALPHGGIDDATTEFALPPAVRATVSPLISALRWGAVMFGMVFAATRAASGDLEVVATLTICLFLTSWRTVIPVRLASGRWADVAKAVIDVAIFGTAIGFSSGFESPFRFCVIAAAAVGAFGWGLAPGIGMAALGIAALGLSSVLTHHPLVSNTQGALTFVMALVIVVVMASFARARLLDLERRRASLAGRIDTLAEANDLLSMLNSVARSLPAALTLREALDGVRDQIRQVFDADVICLLVRDDAADDWSPRLAEGCSLPASLRRTDFPPALAGAIDAGEPVFVSDLAAEGVTPLGQRSGFGIYSALTARDQIVGMLGIEGRGVRDFSERDTRLFDGLTDVIALTVDNAQHFARLRSLGAEDERLRIARDLHDRLGQWLTYISMELERINSVEDPGNPELERLYSEVQSALAELRETLRQLRTGVSDDKPLHVVGAELAYRMSERTGVAVSFTSTRPNVRMPNPVENEFLRILQEALNNVERHSRASKVDITWDTGDHGGTLTIADNGVGFDQSRSVRDSSYGMVGMRERADAVGARLKIDSAPGQGTTVTVGIGSSQEAAAGPREDTR